MERGWLSEDQIFQQLLFSGDPDSKEKLRLFLRYLKYKEKRFRSSTSSGVNSSESPLTSNESTQQEKIRPESKSNGRNNCVGISNGVINENSQINSTIPITTNKEEGEEGETKSKTNVKRRRRRRVIAGSGRITRNKSPSVQNDIPDKAEASKKQNITGKRGRRGRKPKSDKEAVTSTANVLGGRKRPPGRPRTRPIKSKSGAKILSGIDELDKENISIVIENESVERNSSPIKSVERNQIPIKSVKRIKSPIDSDHGIEALVASETDEDFVPLAPEAIGPLKEAFMDADFRNSLRSEAETLSGIVKYFSPNNRSMN